MKKNLNKKYVLFLSIFILTFLSIASITNGLSKWVFSFNSDKKDLSATVLVEDLKENYQFIAGTGVNSSTFDVSGTGNEGKSTYTYKMLGGYNQVSSSYNTFNFTDNTNTLTEFNLYTSSSSGTSIDNTVTSGLGRLYYLDKLYVMNGEGDETTSVKYQGSFISSDKTTSKLYNFTFNAKNNGFVISRCKTSEISDTSINKNDTDNFLYVFNQDDRFIENYGKAGTNYPKNTYKWLQNNVISKVNKYLEGAELPFNFDQGIYYKNKNASDDNMSKFNSFYYNESTILSDYKSDFNSRMKDHFFSQNGLRGYVNVVLFVPFKRDYTNSNIDKSIDASSSSYLNNTTLFPLLTDSSGNYIEEDFAYCAISSAVKDSSNDGFKSFIKIIDYSDTHVGNSFKGICLPSNVNGGFALTSEGYFDYSSNFIDNGNLFVDYISSPDSTIEGTTTKLSVHPVYRRVIGVSINMSDSAYSSYNEPTIASSDNKSDYSLGNTVYNFYTSYPDYMVKKTDEEGNTYEVSNEEWWDTLNASSESDAINQKVDTYSLNINDLITLNNDGTYNYKRGLKLIDHLTYEEVKITQDYIYTYDNDGNITSTSGTGNTGIAFNKSMILLLVDENCNISNTFKYNLDRDNMNLTKN